MKSFFDQKVFSVGSRWYSWVHVMLAAQLWGDWVQLEKGLCEGIACCEYAAANQSGPSVAEVNAAARAYRYERDLISAEETEIWLESWGLDVRDWMGYLRRSLARQHWAREVDARTGQRGTDLDFGGTDLDFGALIKAEAVFSGQLAYFARKLAARAAIYGKIEEESEDGIVPDEPGSTAGGFVGAVESTFQKSLTAGKPCQLSGLDPDSCRAISAQLAALERSFTQFSCKVRTDQAIRDQVRLHCLAWIRLRCLYASFPDENAAQEAAQCVREDSKRLDVVAAAAKANLHEAMFYLEQLESELSARLVGARKGEFFGPLSFDGAPTLMLVLDKTMPSAEDPELRRKAAQSVVESAVEHEVSDRVRWHRSL